MESYTCDRVIRKPRRHEQKRRCCVPNCMDTTSKQYRFPTPQSYTDVFNKWVNAVKSPKFENVAAETIYSNYRVCARHFTEDDIIKVGHRGVKRTAVPSLFLPGPDHLTESELEKTTGAVDIDGNKEAELQETASKKRPVDLDDHLHEADLGQSTSKRSAVDFKGQQILICTQLASDDHQKQNCRRIQQKTCTETVVDKDHLNEADLGQSPSKRRAVNFKGQQILICAQLASDDHQKQNCRRIQQKTCTETVELDKGKPADLTDNNNPDWVPSINMGCKDNEASSTKSKMKRYERKIKREKGTSVDLETLENENTSLVEDTILGISKYCPPLNILLSSNSSEGPDTQDAYNLDKVHEVDKQEEIYSDEDLWINDSNPEIYLSSDDDEGLVQKVKHNEFKIEISKNQNDIVQDENAVETIIVDQDITEFLSDTDAVKTTAHITLSKINSAISEFIERSPEEVTVALESMYRTLKTIHNPSMFAKCCSTFGSAIQLTPTLRKTKLCDEDTHIGDSSRKIDGKIKKAAFQHKTSKEVLNALKILKDN